MAKKGRRAMSGPESGLCGAFLGADAVLMKHT